MDLDGNSAKSLKPFHPKTVCCLFSVIVGWCPPPWLAYHFTDLIYIDLYTSIDSLVCALGVGISLLNNCCIFAGHGHSGQGEKEE